MGEGRGGAEQSPAQQPVPAPSPGPLTIAQREPLGGPQAGPHQREANGMEDTSSLPAPLRGSEVRSPKPSFPGAGDLLGHRWTCQALEGALLSRTASCPPGWPWGPSLRGRSHSQKPAAPRGQHPHPLTCRMSRSRLSKSSSSASTVRWTTGWEAQPSARHPPLQTAAPTPQGTGGGLVGASAADHPLTLPAAHEDLHQLEALRTLGLWGERWGYQAGTRRHLPRTPTGGIRTQLGQLPGPLGGQDGQAQSTHLMPEQREDLQHHHPSSAVCSHAKGHIGHTHPAGDKLRSSGHTP